MPEVQAGSNFFYYTERGSGPNLLLVHGFPLDGRIWDEQVNALSDRARIIVPDLPGFGRSRSGGPFTIASAADDLHMFLQKIGALPCIFGGLSMGGYIECAYMCKYPADLKGLVFIDTKAEADSADAKAGRLKMIEACRQGGTKAVADQMENKALARSTGPAVRRKLRAIMEGQRPATIEAALLAMRDRADYRDKLASIAVPTLIVVGADDSLIPLSVAQSMSREIRHSKLVVIPDAAHLPCMEQPHHLNSALREFIAAL